MTSIGIEVPLVVLVQCRCSVVQGMQAMAIAFQKSPGSSNGRVGEVCSWCKDVLEMWEVGVLPAVSVCGKLHSSECLCVPLVDLCVMFEGLEAQLMFLTQCMQLEFSSEVKS